MREDERGWTASGMGVEVDGVSGVISGSDRACQLYEPTPQKFSQPSFNWENVREIFSDPEPIKVYVESERPRRYSSSLSPAGEMAIVEIDAPTRGTNSFLFECSCQMTRTASSPPLSR